MHTKTHSHKITKKSLLSLPSMGHPHALWSLHRKDGLPLSHAKSKTLKWSSLMMKNRNGYIEADEKRKHIFHAAEDQKFILIIKILKIGMKYHTFEAYPNYRLHQFAAHPWRWSNIIKHIWRFPKDRNNAAHLWRWFKIEKHNQRFLWT